MGTYTTINPSRAERKAARRAAREHPVAGQAPDWRAAKPGHKAPPRRLPKNVRKALRDYRRKVIPMADHDECSWCVLALIGVAAVAIPLASAWGLMP